MKTWKQFSAQTLSAIALLTAIGCGNSGPSKPSVYTIGGAVSGLTAAGLVLQNNGGDKLTMAANATKFTFATPVPSGAAYSVKVLAEPTGLSCTVTGGSGTASANVTTVSVACIQAYTIGGSVFGLTGSGLVLQNNGGSNLTVNASDPTYAFVFPGALPTGGAPYRITVLSNPAGQACTVASPIGIATTSVTTAAVSCTTLAANSYTISGTVSGLTGPGLVLQDNLGINDADLLPINADGSFTFVDQVTIGSAYNIAVLNQPAARNCVITNGSGTASADVTNVSIVCVGEWAWVGGSSTIGSNGGQSGVYGTLGTPDPSNLPGGRQQATTWVDASGKTWLFGGYGEDSIGTPYGGLLNDLWRFDPTLGMQGEWAWMGGSTVTPPSMTFGAAGAPGTYGTQGVPATTNNPGGREQTASWLDASGALWLFGGEGNDMNGVSGQLDDLWKFDPALGADGEWTWMGGSSTGAGPFGGRPGVYGSQGAPDPANIPGGRYGASTWRDGAGNFWMFGGSGSDVNGSGGNTAYLNDLWKYAPSKTDDTGEWTWMGGSTLGNPSGSYGTEGTPSSANVPGGREASASWLDASGNFWMFGGIGQDANGDFAYLNDLWEYTPSATGDTGQWTWMGGSNAAPQPYSGQPGVYGALGVAAAANIPGGRYSSTSWVDASGTFWLFGGQGFDSTGTQGAMNDLWKYTPGTASSPGQWTWVDGSTAVGRGLGQNGVYGILGVAGDNTPGGRFGASGWVDGSGDLWFFGGQGYDAVGPQYGNLNDVWKYQP